MDLFSLPNWLGFNKTPIQAGRQNTPNGFATPNSRLGPAASLVRPSQPNKKDKPAVDYFLEPRPTKAVEDDWEYV